MEMSAEERLPENRANRGAYTLRKEREEELLREMLTPT